MSNDAANAEAILRGQTERIASVSPSVLTRRWAKITVVATFILLFAGALVTGMKAALSDPTWPLFMGSVLPQKEFFKGGLVYEDSHRIIAAIVGLLTFGLALVVQFLDHRRWMKKLAWAAFALVVVQALLGGTIIHSIRHPAVSMIHGFVAQAFFCLTLAIAWFTSKRYYRDAESPKIAMVENAGYVKFLKVSVAIIYVQVILGTGVRHTTDVFLPYLLGHIGFAFAVIILIAWNALRTFHVYRMVTPFRRAATSFLILIGIQVFLGIFAIIANRARLRPEVSELHHVFFSTAHLIVGGVILGLMFLMVLRAHRLLALPASPSHEPPVPGVTA